MPILINAVEVGGPSNRKVGSTFRTACKSNDYVPVTGNSIILCTSSTNWNGFPIGCTFNPMPSISANQSKVAFDDHVELTCSVSIAIHHSTTFKIKFNNRSVSQAVTGTRHTKLFQLKNTTLYTCQACDPFSSMCSNVSPALTVIVDGHNGAWGSWNRTSDCVGVQTRRLVI